MRSAIIKIILLAGAFIAGALLVIRSIPPNPVAILRVVDVAGKPIAGAVIRPDGLRPKRINAHYTWGDDNPVKPTPVTTDARGIARVPYPRYVIEKAETSEISFGIEHTNFCSERPFRVVSAAPPANATLKDKANFILQMVLGRVVARPEPVVLKRGGIVKVSGYLDSKENLLSQIHPQLAEMPVPRAGFWEPVETESNALVNQRIPEGTNSLRLVYFSPAGNACFSDVIVFIAVPGQTNEFCLQLKPGVRLAGRLDDSVPRPVNHGSVQVSVEPISTNSTPEKISWIAWTNLNVDGTFSFDGLPPGNAEVMAICDGFRSKDGAGTKISTIFILPQSFLLVSAEVEAVIMMEPTATCEITVLDDQGHPLAGATAGFWPNAIWGGRGSTIFMGPTINTRDYVRSGEIPDWRKIRGGHQQIFTATSDERGIAVVSNLPAFKQYFYLDHTNYELPIEPRNNSREASISLSPGETSRITVTMKKKGSEFLKSPR